MAQGNAPKQPERTQTRGDNKKNMALGLASWFFAILAFLTLTLGLLGFDFVPHFPLMTFVWLGLAVFFRILKDERAPEESPPAT